MHAAGVSEMVAVGLVELLIGQRTDSPSAPSVATTLRTQRLGLFGSSSLAAGTDIIRGPASRFLV